MFNKKFLSEINILYDINNFQKEKNVIKIFGNKFVQKNMCNCIMIIHNTKYLLTTEFNVENYNNDILNIKLRGIENIIDMSDMFKDCISLISLPDISKWNTSNIINMSGIFRGCLSLSSLSDISKWNTSNVTNMSYMFYNCYNLISLPDISKWNTIKVTNMSYMLCGCKSLTLGHTIRREMINYCFNLSNCNYNYILSFNSEDKTKMSYKFKNCQKLLSFPDISKWNINNVNNISYMFSGCTSLFLYLIFQNGILVI